MPVVLSASPAIWQSYINVLLNNIPHRSKYLAIMNGLLLHILKLGHLKYLKDLLKILLKVVRNITKEVLPF